MAKNSSGMKSAKDIALGALANCFPGDEWEYLTASRRFREVLSDLQTLDQVEEAIGVGLDLLRKRAKTSARSAQFDSENG